MNDIDRLIEDWDFWENPDNIPDSLKTIEGYPNERKHIKGHHDRYEASIYGEIFGEKKDTPLSPGISKDGYLRVVLCENGKPHTKKVHRLVAETFIPNPCNKPEVNHIDGNKQNNRVTNLEWCTHQENVRHAFATGLEKRSEKAGAPKKKIRIVETNEIFDSISECARYIGDDPSHTHISSCINGKRKTHKGLHFEEVTI